MKSLSRDNDTGPSKRTRTADGSVDGGPQSLAGMELLAVARGLAVGEESSALISKAAAVAGASPGRASNDVRVLAAALEAYMLIRSSDAAAAREVPRALSRMAKLVGKDPNPGRRGDEVPLVASLAAGLAAGLGMLPCLTQPLFEARLGFVSDSPKGAHSTAAARSSQARKVSE
jgi:hypothetical protein